MRVLPNGKIEINRKTENGFEAATFSSNVPVKEPEKINHTPWITPPPYDSWREND